MIGLAAFASATFLTGNDLYLACRAPDRGPCLAYIKGVVDGDVFEENRAPLICIPAGVTGGRLADVVTAYLRHRPSWRSTQAGGLVWEALFNEYPCARRAKHIR